MRMFELQVAGDAWAGAKKPGSEREGLGLFAMPEDIDKVVNTGVEAWTRFLTRCRIRETAVRLADEAPINTPTSKAVGGRRRSQVSPGNRETEREGLFHEGSLGSTSTSTSCESSRDEVKIKRELVDR
jgi:hypothetical protein